MKTIESISWTIRTYDAGPIIAEGTLGEERPTLRRGAEATLTFWFSDAGAATSSPRERYQTLREYQSYTDAVYSIPLYVGGAKYHESPGDGRSLLMSFEPGDRVDYPGFWGVVTEIVDASDTPGRPNRLEVTVLVLAELDDYPDRDAVEAALRV